MVLARFRDVRPQAPRDLRRARANGRRSPPGAARRRDRRTHARRRPRDPRAPHGLTTDQLVAAEVVLADGRVVDCHEHSEPDLFWALRAPAVSSRRGHAPRAPHRARAETTTLHLRWPPGPASRCSSPGRRGRPTRRTRWPQSPRHRRRGPGEPPRVHVFGAMVGGDAETATHWARSSTGRAQSPGDRAAQRPYRQANATSPTTRRATSPRRTRRLVQFRAFRRASPPRGRRAARPRRRPHARPAARARPLALGRRLRPVAPDATAFAHREERFLLKHDVAIAPGTENRGGAHERRATGSPAPGRSSGRSRE